MKILNCTKKDVKIFDKTCLTKDYDDWMVDQDKIPMFKLYPTSEEDYSVLHIPDTESIHPIIKLFKAASPNIPSDGYDYYIVNYNQLIYYVANNIHVGKLVLPHDYVLGDYFEISGYTSLKLVTYD
jgi:hypothetical protein